MDANPKLSFVCPVKWDAMRGDERERFCEKCQRSVINISRMTKAQRAALLERARTDQVCVADLQRVQAAKPVSRWSVRRRAATVALFGLSAAGALIAAVVADVKRSSPPLNPHTTAREKMEYYYHTARYRVEEWVDDVRVYFGGTPRYAMILGAISPHRLPAPVAAPPSTPAPMPAPAKKAEAPTYSPAPSTNHSSSAPAESPSH